MAFFLAVVARSPVAWLEKKGLSHLGPVGMLLSVPLTTALKIVLETREATRPIALLLGSGSARDLRTRR